MEAGLTSTRTIIRVSIFLSHVETIELLLNSFREFVFVLSFFFLNLDTLQLPVQSATTLTDS